MDEKIVSELDPFHLSLFFLIQKGMIAFYQSSSRNSLQLRFRRVCRMTSVISLLSDGLHKCVCNHLISGANISSLKMHATYYKLPLTFVQKKSGLRHWERNSQGYLEDCFLLGGIHTQKNYQGNRKKEHTEKHSDILSQTFPGRLETNFRTSSLTGSEKIGSEIECYFNSYFIYI